MQQKFKNPLVGADQFYLQYKLSSEEYPINIEVSDRAQALSAFKKFAELQKVRGEGADRRMQYHGSDLFFRRGGGAGGGFEEPS